MTQGRGHDVGTQHLSRLAGADIARGERITAAMEARGLNFNCELCYDLGVTESSLSRWRCGKPMSISMAAALARALGVSLEWLITGGSLSTAAQTAAAGHDTAEIGYVASLFTALRAQDRRLVLEVTTRLVHATGRAIEQI